LSANPPDARRFQPAGKSASDPPESAVTGTGSRHQTFPMQLRPILALALLLVARPAAAEEGFLDRLFGGSGRGAPPNPFASNYPSAPPTAGEARAARARRDDRGVRGDRSGPLPPGRIPEE
jgi:hypothetical protein